VGRGVMCPSYKATRDENFSTRGRANLLRKALNSNNPLKELSGKELKEALDLCLGCKACKTECPASVDMARLKSEYLYQTQKKQDKLELWRIKNLGKILKFGSKAPELFNLTQNSTIAKKINKLEGALPQLKSTTLSKWWEYNKQIDNKYEVTVWVLCDIYTEYYDTQAGKDLLNFLKSCKVNIELINLDTSIIALISKGLLNEAKQALNKYCAKLFNISKQDLIVGIDPSEALVWRDDAKYLVKKTLQVNLFEELVIKLNKNNLIPKLKPIDQKVYIHLHCHQKSLVSEQVTIDAFSLIPKLKVKILNIGCCGMAGDFGYIHTEISKKVYKDSIDIMSSMISTREVLVTGFSCKNMFIQEKRLNLRNIFELFLT
jgi:Fe-S oxidoreductase